MAETTSENSTTKPVEESVPAMTTAIPDITEKSNTGGCSGKSATIQLAMLLTASLSIVVLVKKKS